MSAAIADFTRGGARWRRVLLPVAHARARRVLVAECASRRLLRTGSSDFHGPEHRVFSRFLDFDTYGLEPDLGPLVG